MKVISTLLIAFVVVFASCRSARDLSEPEFRDISNVRVVDVGLFKTTAGADMIFYNPNSSGIQLSSARGDVYIDNSYFGSFQLNESVQVKKRSEFTVPVTIKIDNIGALKNQGDIYKKKEAKVRIEGHALLRKAGFSREVPIKYEQVQDMDRLRAIVSR